MMPARNGVEFGDFQTPRTLADQVCTLLRARGLAPASVVEPTCGLGSFLLAALDMFPTAERGLGVEIHREYVEQLADKLRAHLRGNTVRMVCRSFFDFDWAAALRSLPDPLLVIGNPPWVTNAALGALGSTNVPEKTNALRFAGIEAVTGKSNFDISEWMLCRLLELLSGRHATLAMLCKTAVARKALVHAWKNGIGIEDAEIRGIDALGYFDAAVDACLLVCSLSRLESSHERDCRVYRGLGDREPSRTIGFRDGRLIADLAAYAQLRHLDGEGLRWRSGVKHDCARVMELRQDGRRYRNGLGQVVDLEDDFVFPMRKSAELAPDRPGEPSRWMLVTQRAVGDDTRVIRTRAPKTWRYLEEHAPALDRRASAIYRNRPRFSIFGIGDYTFSPWKVAISGFHKRLYFAVVGSAGGKPTVLDDTGYFVACRTEREARKMAALLNSDAAQDFYNAYVFWDAKRPVTVELLRRLDVNALAGNPLKPAGRSTRIPVRSMQSLTPAFSRK